MVIKMKSIIKKANYKVKIKRMTHSKRTNKQLKFNANIYNVSDSKATLFTKL